MPDNQRNGMLEDFCTEMAEQNALKAIIHNYLAWQDEPGRPLGQAITMQALKPHTPNAVRFVEWLNLLFNAGVRKK